ncbi:Ig-like domain-containing protein [Streptomyces sp. NPDC001107]
MPVSINFTHTVRDRAAVQRAITVEGSNGVHGVQNKDVTFHIGRAQISTVDLSTEEMVVERDGQRRQRPAGRGPSTRPTG